MAKETPLSKKPWHVQAAVAFAKNMGPRYKFVLKKTYTTVFFHDVDKDGKMDVIGRKQWTKHSKMGYGEVDFQDQPPKLIDAPELKNIRCATLHMGPPQGGGTTQVHTIFADGRIRLRTLASELPAHKGIRSDIQTLRIIHAIHETLKKHA